MLKKKKSLVNPVCDAVDWFSGLLMICSLIHQQTQQISKLHALCWVAVSKHFIILLPVPEGLLDTEVWDGLSREGMKWDLSDRKSLQDLQELSKGPKVRTVPACLQSSKAANMSRSQYERCIVVLPKTPADAWNQGWYQTLYILCFSYTYTPMIKFNL